MASGESSAHCLALVPITMTLPSVSCSIVPGVCLANGLARSGGPSRNLHCIVFLHHAELVTITGKSYRLRNCAIPNSNEEQASANSQWPVGPEPRCKARQESQRPTTAAAEAATI